MVVLKERVINFKAINGNREWVTYMDIIGIYGQTIPLFIIFKKQQYTDSLWETAEEAVSNYLIRITENGWLNREIGFKWLKYFK